MTREEITQAGKEYARQYTRDQGQHFADFVAGADCVQAQTEQKAIDDAERDALDARMYGINMKILEKKKSEWLDKAYEWWSKTYLMGEPDCYEDFCKALED